MGEGLKVKTTGKVMIIGVGNELLKDEGVGVHVVRALRENPSPGGVELEIIDGGTSPYIFDLIEGVDRLIVIDAVKDGGEPATVYRFAPEDVIAGHKNLLSLHEVGLLENLRLLEQLGARPKDTVIIGVEPKEIDWGLELSPEVERIIPEVIRVVLKEVDRQ